MQSAAELISEGRRTRAGGDRCAARAYYGAAAEQFRREGLTLSWAHAVRHIADMWLEDEQFAQAQPLYEQTLEAYRGSLETRVIDLANTLRPYALLNEAIGDPDLAGALWLEAKTLYASIRVNEGVRECEAHLHVLSRS